MSAGPWQRADAQAVLESALKATGSMEAEARMGGGSLALTRFANNQIHQNVVEEWPRLSLRVILRSRDGSRSAQMSTSRFDDASLRKLARDVRALARLTAPRKDVLPLADPATYQETNAWNEHAATAGPARLADGCSKVILPCRKAGLNAAGLMAAHRMSIGDYSDPGTFAIHNSKGLFAYHRRTEVRFSATVMSPDSSGWCLASGPSFADLDPAALGATAIEKAERSRRPAGLEPGPTRVVLEPNAVASLLWFLLGSFSAQAVQEGRSCLSGRIGEKLFGEHINLRDDVFHPLHQGRPWDGEGVPTRRVDLVKAGVVKGLVYSRREAKKDQVKPTGHGPPLPATDGSFPRHPVLGGGEGSVDDLIQRAGEGVLITRLWYNRMVDERHVRVTGMTRDGTLKIRGGRLAGGLKNLRYNVSVIDALNQSVAASAPVRAGGMVVPALLVEGFPFTSGTRF